MILDFALLCEKGRSGNFGLSANELKQRFSKAHDEQDVLQERINEYMATKINLMIDMIKRAIDKGLKFRYVLADSWFACKDIIRFIRSHHMKCDNLGMIKAGESGKTKYHFERKDFTAPALIKFLTKRKQCKYSRKLRSCYMVADVVFADTKVRLFFVKRSKNGVWNGLITTDLTLDFFRGCVKTFFLRKLPLLQLSVAGANLSLDIMTNLQRWAQEVVFKEAKGLLGLRKYQANNFVSQIAVTSLTALQYNILSIVKRFAVYETMGKLFKKASKDSLELLLLCCDDQQIR